MDVQSRLEEICSKLNIELSVQATALENYEKTRKVFSLEGDQLHWLCCSLTYACWQANVDSVLGEFPVHGNGVSFNSILRICNIGFRQYFTLINKWNEMNSVPAPFQVRIDQLKKNFSNTIHVYKKYWEYYRLLFNYAKGSDEFGSHPGPMPKGAFSGQTQKRKKEKVKCTPKTMYEFCWCLYASIKAELNENVKDLIMTHNLLLCCLDLMFANCVSEKRFDLINPNFPGLPEGIKSGSVPNQPVCILKHLTDENTLVEVLAMQNYDFQTSIRKLIANGSLAGNPVNCLDLLSDENFDTNYRGINSLYDEYVLSHGEIDEKLFLVADNFGVPQHPSQTLGGPGNNVDSVPPPTPLTRATDSVRKLNSLIGELHSVSPPARLVELFKSCSRNPLPFIEAQIERNKRLYMTRVQLDIGNRFHTVVQVAFHLLGNIYEAEQSKKNAANVEALLSDENLINSLMACCVEIVNSAYNNPMQFPWILECFELNAFVFYRIIEPVVLNHRDLLTAHVIRHLTRIEEQCMESYVWVERSPVWDLLRDDPVVPTCEASRAHVGLTANGTVHRNLFPGGADGGPTSKGDGVAEPNKTLSSDLTTISYAPNTPGSTPRKRSMTMFFRKFYIQAFNRLQTLFKDLDMGEAAQLTEIWTIFEYVVVHHLELMRNRHLDQLIMCAVYVYAKAKPHVRNGQFKTIMQKYRNQPHSSSHVYRNVYIGPATEAALQAIRAEEQGNSDPPRPMDDVPGHSVSHQNEIRGDIIQFYNNVYMPPVQQFALRFSNESDKPFMSPVPQQVRQNTPRKVCNALYVSTQEQQKCAFMSPVEIRLPHSSPLERRDFTEINEMIRSQPSAKKQKRVLSYEGDDETQIGGTQKLKKMMKDRTETMAK